MKANKALGIEGENAAVKWLRSKGYKILRQNWRHEHFEVDIIASRDGFIVFVEVKTRSEKVSEIEDLISISKERAMTEAANRYMEMLGDDKVECRIDLVILEKQGKKFQVTHIEDVLGIP